MERRLAAIMFVDIVGYTALMAESEAKGLRARERHRGLVRPLVEKYHGEAIEARGDESLAVFPTALDAVNCALAIEEALAGDTELRLHIGIHVGDFVLERGEVSGDAVNIAARIRSFAESGVCVSAEVYHSVRNQPNVEARSLGSRKLKNVGRPVALFAVKGTAAAPSTTPTRSAPAAEHGRIRSLAVLPLENLSGDPSQEYFADGMTEMLIGDLGKLRSLRVISRTSVMQYKGVRKPLPQIAAELGVDALLEGTVMREGDRVRITAQLIDGRTDHHVWSERYDRDLRGILELQSDVARAVAREIELELSPAEVAELANRPRIVPAAHDLLLRGLYQLGRFTGRSVQSAIASFERAIELDPAYAAPHAWLAMAWQEMHVNFRVPALEAMPRAKSAALRALELDAALAEAHVALGLVALRFDWDWPAARRHFERALERNPSLPVAHYCMAMLLSSRCRHDEAIAEAQRAADLSPLDQLQQTFLAAIYREGRRFGDALEVVHRVLELDPTFPNAHLQAALAYLGLDRYEDVIRELQACGANSGEQAAALRAGLSEGGKDGFWSEWLRQVSSVPATPRWMLATAYAQLGDRDKAFEELERAFALREGGFQYLRVVSTFDPIRDDPRFADLLHRVGIPES